MRTTELAFTVGRHDAKASRAGGAHDMPQQEQGWFICPMQVIEDEEHRLRPRGERKHGGNRFEQTVSLSLRVHRRRAWKCGNAVWRGGGARGGARPPRRWRPVGILDPSADNVGNTSLEIQRTVGTATGFLHRWTRRG